MRITFSGLAAACLLTVATAAAAQPGTQNLPPAVKATIEAESKGATVKGVSKEKEHGKTVYELETVVGGRTRDLMIDAEGKVYLVEEQVDPAKAPPAVREALQKAGTIVGIESVTTKGATHYEGRVRGKNGKVTSLELEADGTPVKK
jgi:uncharacterized membrane protein YkoI